MIDFLNPFKNCGKDYLVVNYAKAMIRLIRKIMDKYTPRGKHPIKLSRKVGLIAR